MNSIFIKLTGNTDRHEMLDGFQFQLDLTTHFGVICPWAVKKKDVSSFSVTFNELFVKLVGNEGSRELHETSYKYNINQH